jgi:hypothetical protein
MAVIGDDQMTTRDIRGTGTWCRVALRLLAPTAVWLAGCATPAPTAAPATAQQVANPAAHPVRNVTDFTDGLRCSDDLMMKFGTRDLVIVLEDVKDKTGHDEDHSVRIPAAGAREMMISAISDMTKRSRAVRLVAGPGDAKNLTDLIDAAKRESPFRIVPQYAWRGAFTQFDADIETKRSLFSVFFAKITGAGAEAQTSSSAIAMDASIVRTSDLTVIPTTVSRNVLVLSRSAREIGSNVGGGGDGTSALLGKFGVTYSFAVNSQDALAQSARALVELAAIETIGRLAQVPYWKCLGADENSPEVRREIEDWYLGLQNDGRLTGWVQEVLRTKRRFDGPTDGEPSGGFTASVAQARKDLNLKPNDVIDLPLFRELIADHLAAQPKAVLAAGSGTEAIDLRPSISAGAPGAPISLEVDSRRDQYVYCYQRNADGKIERIFPNRFHPDPMLLAQRRIELPGPDPFRLTLGGPDETTRFACIASPIEVYNELGPKLRWGDFHPIGFKSFEEIRSAFETAAGVKLGYVEREVLVQKK